MLSDSRFFLLFVFIWICAATATFAGHPVHGIFQSSAPDGEQNLPEFVLSVLDSPLENSLLLIVSNYDDSGFTNAEYEGKAKPDGTDSWIVTWTKKRSTKKVNVVIPSVTPIKYSNNQYILSLSKKRIQLRATRHVDLVSHGMYNEPPYSFADFLYSSADRDLFFYIKRQPDGEVEISSFSRKEPVPVKYGASNWQVRLTRFYETAGTENPQDGYGAIVDLADLKGKKLRIQFDGSRTPESDATFTLTRPGEPDIQFTGIDPTDEWVPTSAGETFEGFGNYRRFSDKKNPGGIWLDVKEENGEELSLAPIAGGASLKWLTKRKEDGTPEEGILTGENREIHFKVKTPNIP